MTASAGVHSQQWIGHRRAQARPHRAAAFGGFIAFGHKMVQQRVFFDVS